jgi:hypothetical protein
MGTKNLTIVLVYLFLCVSCASLPAPRQIQNEWMIDRPFTDVWRAALETLAEMNINVIEPLDKESGMIMTNLTNFPEDDKACWDCGKLSFTQFDQGHRGKVTIFVKNIDEAKTALKIIANFEVVFTDSMHESLTKSRLERAVQGDTLFQRPCVSTGKWEADFYGIVQEKLK